jgi:hypothetical protein
VWLVKAPDRVAKLWDKAMEQQDAKLGTIKLYVTDGNLDEMTMHLEGASSASASGIPLSSDFKLSWNPDNRPDKLKDAPKRVFSKGSGGVEMVGQVEHSFFMQPIKSAQYTSFVQKRRADASIKTRVTKELNSFDAMRYQSKTKVIKLSENPDRPSEPDSKRRKTEEMSGDPLEEDELRKMIVSLFGVKDVEGEVINAWKKADLRKEVVKKANAVDRSFTDTQFTNVLTKICDYNKDSRGGEKARTYQLKARYKA